MTVREIIICLSKQEGLTQEELAHKLGLKGSANIAVPLSRNDGMGMKVDTLVRWLEALNAEIVIQHYDGEHEFILDGDEFGGDLQMRYGYGRVSARDQNLARQIAALKKFDPDLPDDHIYTDKQSGKNFNRKHYLELKAILVPGDEILVEELDRFGRNKAEIKAELEWFKEHGVIVRVFDVPTTLIDFRGQEWIGEMVNNILIEVMGAMAEQERKKIRKRQAEGIAAMPVVNGRKVSGKTGRGFGRPACQVDNEAFQALVRQQREGLITVNDACRQLGISRPTWYDRVRKVG